MIQERALVLEREAKDPKQVWVRTQRQSACDSCKLKAGCGQSALSKLSGDKSMELEVTNSFNAQPGDVVILSIPEEGILAASAIMYLLPLIAMVALAMLASSLGGNELAVVMGGAIGLVLGFSYARHYSHSHKDDPRFSPTMASLALTASADSGCV